MAHAAGGTPAERILRRLGIPVSDDTILRQLLRSTETGARSARVIGIDDWSWRKSQSYGTIIIDLERRAVIDVLEDRDVVTCTDWLKRHPEVEVISRDRGGLYAQSARQGAPQAAQVADRFLFAKTTYPTRGRWPQVTPNRGSAPRAPNSGAWRFQAVCCSGRPLHPVRCQPAPE